MAREHWPKKHPWLTVGAFVLVGGIGMFAAMRQGQQSAKEATEAQREVAKAQTELLNWQRGDPKNPPHVDYLMTVDAAGLRSAPGTLTIRFTMYNPSEFPAYDINVRVWDIDSLPKEPATLEEILSHSVATVDIPPLAPGTGQVIGNIEVPPTASTKRFGAQFITRVGHFSENIKAQKVNGAWLFAIQVRRFDASNEIVFRSVPAGFPLNAAGDVDW